MSGSYSVADYNIDDGSHSVLNLILLFCFFFFKQKTAYEIGQWLEFRRVLFRSPRRSTLKQSYTIIMLIIFLPPTTILRFWNLPLLSRVESHDWPPYERQLMMNLCKLPEIIFNFDIGEDSLLYGNSVKKKYSIMKKFSSSHTSIVMRAWLKSTCDTIKHTAWLMIRDNKFGPTNKPVSEG